MARRKVAVDIEALANDVAEALQALSLAGYRAEVEKIRQLLQVQGEGYVKSTKVNRDINSSLATRLRSAEKALKANGIPLPYSDDA